MLRTKWLTDQGRPLTRAEIARALDGHLCRCTGYVKIIDAVELIFKAKRSRAAAAAGQRRRRRQVAAALSQGANSRSAPGRSSPTSTCPACCTAPWCCRPMRVPACSGIDIRKAAGAAGRRRRSPPPRTCPGDRWVGLIYKDWPCFVAEGEEVRTSATCVAVVAAETPRAARAAAALVEVDYEVLPAVVDPAEASSPARRRSIPGTRTCCRRDQASSAATSMRRSRPRPTS